MYIFSNRDDFFLFCSSTVWKANNKNVHQSKFYTRDVSSYFKYLQCRWKELMLAHVVCLCLCRMGHVLHVAFGVVENGPLSKHRTVCLVTDGHTNPVQILKASLTHPGSSVFRTGQERQGFPRKKSTDWSIHFWGVPIGAPTQLAIWFPQTVTSSSAQKGSTYGHLLHLVG